MGDPFHIVSLCSGGAGLDRGIHLAVEGSRTVVYVEREGFACEVLVSQMEAGWLAPAPVFTDIRSFDGKPWRGVVHCVAAGYPCQGESLAGNRLGADDDRWLWPDVARIIREIQPQWVFLENVAGHVSMGLRQVATDLDEMGFRFAAGLFRASEVGAPHSRERIFILGHMADANGHALRVEPERSELRSPVGGDTESREPSSRSSVADARASGRGAGERHLFAWQPDTGGRGEGGANASGDSALRQRALADPECAERRAGDERGGCEVEGGDAERQAPGGSRERGEVLADSDGHGRDEVPEGVRGRIAIPPVRGTRVAHAAKLGRGKGRAQQRGLVGQPPPELDSGAVPVGHADGQGLALGDHQRRDAEQELAPVERAGGAVADSDSGGRQGERVEELGGVGGAPGYFVGGQGSEGPGTAPYPPGPDDADGWDAYLRVYPWITPAVTRAQRVLRRGADGVAADVDGPGVLEALRAAITADPYGRNRMDRLRLLGNGVNPDQAALALRILAQDLEAVEKQDGPRRSK